MSKADQFSKVIGMYLQRDVSERTQRKVIFIRQLKGVENENEVSRNLRECRPDPQPTRILCDLAENPISKLHMPVYENDRGDNAMLI